MIGTTLAHYRVTASLGAGGMGEVWRATDLKLGREVALKVLPAEFAEDEERLARFEREAKVLASLNHPNIAHLYGLETATPARPPDASGTETGTGTGTGAGTEELTFLVMELVEGEGLDEVIARGPVPVDEAVPIARQIAEALEAAHEAGIVHRDLKPANVKIRRDGAVKVLDFGLAKAWDEVGTTDLSISPTLTARHTRAGVILGTAAYMSPEQARGKHVDRRSDIWAFGVVLWEMLTGRALFSGDTISDVIARILTQQPNLDDLPSTTPPSIRRLLRRCLERQLGRRQRHLGDAILDLEDGLHEYHQASPDVPDAPGPTARPTLQRFKLTTEVCRTIDRADLDPAIIGRHLEYLDNERPSETLVLYLAGFGQEHATFTDVLSRSPYRGIAVTLFGFEKSRQRRVPLPMSAHLKIVRALLEELIRSIGPDRVILTGFSSGADVAQRLVAEAGVDGDLIDGILALGPNLDLNTCFITAKVAEIPDDRPGEIFPLTKSIMGSATSVDAWLRMNPYLSEVLRKYHDDVGALRRHGHDVVEPFARSGNRAAAAWYREAKSRGIAVRLVFASTQDEQDPLRDLLFAHVENGIMGPEFVDTDIETEPDSDHFTLMDASVIEKHLASLLDELRGSRKKRAT